MLIAMNDRELQRFSVIQDVLHCNLSRQDASRILGISYRQLSRLITSFVMFHESFRTLYWREFTSIKQGAEFFHVSKPTITRWLDGTVPINPMAEKLLLIKSLGYLPNDIRWSGFLDCEKRAILITPSGREFGPNKL